MIVRFNSVHSPRGDEHINVLPLTCWYSSVYHGMGPAVTSPRLIQGKDRVILCGVLVSLPPLNRVSLSWPC